jgi:hypothetical protein
VTVKLFSGKKTKKGQKAEQNNIELSINGAFSSSRTGIYSLISGAKTEIDRNIEKFSPQF